MTVTETRQMFLSLARECGISDPGHSAPQELRDPGSFISVPALGVPFSVAQHGSQDGCAPATARRREDEERGRLICCLLRTVFRGRRRLLFPTPHGPELSREAHQRHRDGETRPPRQPRARGAGGTMGSLWRAFSVGAPGSRRGEVSVSVLMGQMHRCTQFSALREPSLKSLRSTHVNIISRELETSRKEL